MVLSASSVIALDDYGSSWYVVMRQAMWLAVGTAACVLVLRVDYHRWRPLATPALAISGRAPRARARARASGSR